MPSVRLGSSPTEVRAFDVVGVDAELEGFVRHVGLYNAEGGGRHLRNGDDAPVAHMKPPLEHGDTVRAHVVGSIPLNDDEAQQVKLWINERMNEYETTRIRRDRQYIIRPHFEEHRPRDARVHYRFSCAGFVIEALREVGVDLLITDEDRLPLIDRATIQQAYPEAMRLQSRLHLFGLDGQGPWPVVLCGYILNALNRPESEIRSEAYQAHPGDERFPASGR